MERKIEGTERAIAAMGRWAPSDLAYIERLEFQATDDEPTSVTIIGLFQDRERDAWPDIGGAMRRVTLRFEGVNGLRLKEFGGGRAQIMGFDIRSVADRGWENTFFEIEDYEDGRLGFTCARAQVLEVEENDTYL